MPIVRRVAEEGASEGQPVTGWIGIERTQHHPARKRADFPLVFQHERVWQTDRGGKADDGNSDCWCDLPRDDRLAGPRLAGPHAYRASAPSAYRAGDSGETVGQGESLATSTH